MWSESEAKTKWCVNVDDHDGPVHPRFACQGSACMAWRWHNTDEWVIRANTEFAKTGKIIPNEQGYCGLAGKP